MHEKKTRRVGASTHPTKLIEGDARLANPYGIIAVSKDKHPGTNYDGAMKYIEWITSPEVQKMIGEYKKGGKQLFHPNDN